MINLSITQSVTIGQQPAALPSYLQPFICELHYAPGKKRPEIFLLPRDTQPGATLPINNQFITVIEKLNSCK